MNNLSIRDLEYLQRCYEIASLSNDPRHKVGCMIISPRNGLPVISRGHNRIPNYMEETDVRWMHKPTKREIVVHAEEDAILKSHACLMGCTLYSNYRPCRPCARLIIHIGIVRVVWDKSNESYPSPVEWFQEAGVEMAWKEQS